MPAIPGDHMWMIPVSAGGSFGPVPSTWAPMVPPWEFNVQWNFQSYPAGLETAQACVAAHPAVVFTRSNAVGEPNKLNVCHGEWLWRSCTDGAHITVGGQLGVGVVFSRLLHLYSEPLVPPFQPVPAGADTWDTVEAWVKFRLNVANANVFDAVHFSINETTTPVALFSGLGVPIVRNWIAPGLATAGNWFVAYAFKTGGWNLWTSENLRAVLTVLGTSIPANVGLSVVDVEWFAIRLRTQGFEPPE